MGFKENTNGSLKEGRLKFQGKEVSKAKCFKASKRGLILNTRILGE